jgi:hypothetical protein
MYPEPKIKKKAVKIIPNVQTRKTDLKVTYINSKHLIVQTKCTMFMLYTCKVVPFIMYLYL